MRENKKIKPLDFLLFTTKSDVNSRIEIIVNKKLALSAGNYFSLIFQNLAIEEKKLIFLDEVVFFEILQNKNVTFEDDSDKKNVNKIVVFF